jgi:hypothetical protein
MEFFLQIMVHKNFSNKKNCLNELKKNLTILINTATPKHTTVELLIRGSKY